MTPARTRPRRGHGSRLVGTLLLLAAGALLFLAGLGVGRALDEAPPAEGEVTLDRTLEPLPLGGTVTVTAP